MRQLVLAGALCCALGAWAQEPERAVIKTDGGFVVESAPALTDAGALDAGTAQTLQPPALLVDSPAPYPPGTEASGNVVLELLIDEAGEVTSSELKSSVDPALDEAALHASTRLKFVPARLGETAVAVRLTFTYRFHFTKTMLGALKGLVRSKGTRAPILGASVSSSDRAETNAKGQFTLSLPAGERQITVTAPGFKLGTFTEQLRANETVEVVYALEPTVVNPYETVVRGERVRTEVSRVSLEKQELREVPGTMGDPFRVVMLMPGVSSVVSGLAYPVVRGSQPAATGYFLDGIRVPLLLHLFLGPAVVHPDFVDGIDFYPGAAPPQYGRLLGGVIDGRISRAREEGFHGSVYADLINAGAFLEYPFEKTGTSISVAGRVSYTPYLLALVGNAVQPPPPPGKTNPSLVLDFYDYQARIEQKMGDGRLRLFAFGSSDVFGTRIDPETSVATSAGVQAILFHRVDLRYRTPVGRGEFEAGATYGLDRLEFQSTRTDLAAVDPAIPSEPTETVFRIDETKIAARLMYAVPVSSNVRFVSGSDLDHRRSALSLGTRVGEVGQDGNPVNNAVNVLSQPAAIGTFLGGYAQLVWTRVKALTVTTGIRVDSYHLSHGPTHVAVEPRVTARYGVTETLTLKAGFGFYHQPPSTLINLPVVDVAGLRAGIQEALQLNVGAEWKLWRGLELNIDGYVNPLLHTIELDVLGAGDLGVGLPSSNGLAYGLEVMLRHPIGDRWFGWLSYTLQRSTRYERWSRYDSRERVIGTSQGDVPFVFDQTHILNLVLSYKFNNNITVGVAVHFNTGRPEAGGVTSRTQREGETELGTPRWVRVDRDAQDRLPPFLRVDARVAKAWAFNTFSLEVYLDLLNASISREVVSFDYGDDTLPSGYGTLEKIPIALPIVLPTLGVKASF
ncbi:MAG: TonB-dependent receptor domain-containing protein [Myxococcaceae bacterium]